jgi:hypothetical protein
VNVSPWCQRCHTAVKELKVKTADRGNVVLTKPWLLTCWRYTPIESIALLRQRLIFPTPLEWRCQDARIHVVAASTSICTSRTSSVWVLMYAAPRFSSAVIGRAEHWSKTQQTPDRPHHTVRPEDDIACLVTVTYTCTWASSRVESMNLIGPARKAEEGERCVGDAVRRSRLVY